MGGEGAKGWKEVAGWERGLLGGASTEPRDPGGLFRGLAGALCARESCNSDSSPEPAAACSERGLLGGANAEPRDPRGWLGEGWQAHSVREREL